MNATIEITNDLRHKIRTTDQEGNSMTISIRLNDECYNGHQDFAITADIYEKGKPKTDRYFIMGGCCHEEILKAMPELKIFVDLHLCDYLGIPMHCVANGFYFLQKGFDKEPIESEKFKPKYCDYYRITPQQFDELNKCDNQLQYALSLEKLGILDQWEKQADKAIEMLENMTGKKFVVDSRRNQYQAPTQDELREEKDRQASGYYTDQAKEERKKQAQKKLMDDLIADRDKAIKKITDEFEVKKRVLEIGGKKALDNCIYYNHTQTLSFNWRGYDPISTELYDAIVAAIVLPDGVKITNEINRKR